MNETISFDGICSECKKDHIPVNNEKIGKSITSTINCGTGKARTTISYHQCMTCGSIWERTVDSGIGGHNKVEKRLK